MAEPREPPQGAGKQKPVYARRTTMDGVRLMDSAKLASYVAEARIMEHEQDRVKHGSKSKDAKGTVNGRQIENKDTAFLI